MFKDAGEELARLEAELLKEETEEELQEEELWEEEQALPPEEDVYLAEEGPAFEYEDTRPADGPVIYQNYSNNYGKGLRNYASGYRAYNTDVTDEDLDAYSEEVLHAPEERSNTSLVLVICLLSLGIVAALLVWMFLLRGNL